MPRARANIIAKFIAHTEIGLTVFSSTSPPAEAIKPAKVSNSGRPAATREPKASTMMTSVTGQENSSAFSIASWLALLKSLHRAEDPVGYTSIPLPAKAVSGALSSSTAFTMASVLALAPAMRIPVCPSGLIDMPGCGGITCPNRGSWANSVVALARVSCIPGSLTRWVSECTTSWTAAEELPPKCC